MTGPRYRKNFKNGAWPFLAAMAAANYGSGKGAQWGDFSGWDGTRRRHRRRRRMFGNGELRLLLLHLIAEEQRHGYELIKAIEDMTDGDYSPSPGTVYPTLSLLEDEGAIKEVDGDAKRRAFKATKAGKKELKDRADELGSILDRFGADDEEQRDERPAPDLIRAAGNLATALANKVRDGSLDADAREQLVDLIDEFARKIERL